MSFDEIASKYKHVGSVLKPGESSGSGGNYSFWDGLEEGTLGAGEWFLNQAEKGEKGLGDIFDSLKDLLKYFPFILVAFLAISLLNTVKGK